MDPPHATDERTAHVEICISRSSAPDSRQLRSVCGGYGVVGTVWWAWGGGYGVVGRVWWVGCGRYGVVGRVWWVRCSG